MWPSKKKMILPKAVDVVLTGDISFRMRYESGDCSIETKYGDRDWEKEKYIQKVVIEVDVETMVPRVTLTKLIIPKRNS